MYYVLDRSDRPGRWIGDYPFIRELKWRYGQRFSVSVPEPLEYELKRIDTDASDHGPEMPEMLKANTLLFRDDLISALHECGVDNVDYYETKVKDPESGVVHTNYKAANIIGLVAAADMAKSDATVHPGGPVLDVDFDRLAIDESKVGGLLMFRLAESSTTVLVHERVKTYLVKKGFNNLTFYDPDDVAT